MKNVGHLKSIPKTLGNDKEISQALSIANTATLTPEELELQQKKLRWLSDQKTNLARAEQAERENAKAQKAAQEALDKALKAETERQTALDKAKAAEYEKQTALDKAETAEYEKQAALDKAETAEAEKQQVEAEKKAALEKAKNAEKAAKLQIAKQLLQANADIAFIRQVTGLKKMEITKLK